MVDLKNISRIYFIGIGGIGMSAVARYFNINKVAVSGYDKTSTPLTKQLESEGINIHYEDSIHLLDKEAEMVVYTPAIPKSHTELNYYLHNNYLLVKRSDVLGQITDSTFNISIAGTHGKTTISTMTAHILRDSGYGCNAFLGGISVNYNTNFWSSNNNVCVIEADEYDRSFLKLKSDIAVISGMDADHLDIYGTEEVMQQAFIDFSANIRSNGLLLSKFGLNKSTHLQASDHIRYSLQNNSADAYGANIKMMNGSYEFDVLMKDWMLDNVVLNMGGMHNVENALAAIIIAHQLGIENNKIKEAIKNFKGVKRRFEYIIAPSGIKGKPEKEASAAKGSTNAPLPVEKIRKEELVFIDDYAHHPEELKALIQGAKSLFSEKKCIIVFQPHLYSRTRDLAKEFAESLDMADEIILLPIYPARELPIENVSSELILKNMSNKNVQLLTKDELLEWAEMQTFYDRGGIELLIVAGAGDIDQLIEPLKKILT